MPQLARIDEEDEDTLSDEERTEALKLFRPGRLVGARSAMTLARIYGKGEPTRNLRAVPRGGRQISNVQTLFWGFIAVSAGALVGWFWRKHRESVVREKARVIKVTKPRDLVGLDVVTSCL